MITDSARDLLHLLWEVSLSNGGDFGFSDEAFAEFDGSVQSFAGLFGSLIEQGFISADANASVNGKKLNTTEYTLTDEGLRALGVG